MIDMFRVAKADHPDLVDGIVWSACELAWINERITLAILAERESCAKLCDDEAEAANMMVHSSILTDAGRMLHEGKWGGAMNCAAAIRARSNHA